MIERETRIYVLIDPTSKEIRYVGKTVKTLKNRLYGHITQSKDGKSDTYRDRWIRGLSAQGLRPEIREIEVCGADWANRERFWIAHFRDAGARLTNHTDGGEGALGFRFTEERRKQCSERLRAELSDPEVKAARIESLIKNATSPEFRKRRSRDHSEWLMAHPEFRAKSSEGMRRQMANPERRRRASEHLKNVMSDPVRRAKRDAKVAEFWTPERRAEQADRARAQAAERRARRENEVAKS